MTHSPVLVAEVIRYFCPRSGDTLLDATLGHGGHARSYLEASRPEGRVIGIDADASAVAQAKVNLQSFSKRVVFVHDTFARIDQIVQDIQGEDNHVRHILFDLGMGSHQIGDERRGFSFAGGGPLLMKYGDVWLPPSDSDALRRLEKSLGRYPDADDIVKKFSTRDLEHVIRSYGEERNSHRIAKAIVHGRKSLITALDLAKIIEQVVPRRGSLHPATRTFQALRIVVNRELESLRVALPNAVKSLAAGGILCIISFHSLEDRIVKNFLKQEPSLLVVTKHTVRASPTEIHINRRARSAQLRVAQKL